MLTIPVSFIFSIKLQKVLVLLQFMTLIDSELPSSYRLEQNYPNPFNPSTTISFSIPERVYVTLKVFDVLGNEVADLISKELSAGKYNVKWNAENISSGVYFYRIQAGSFIETKKLILLR